MIEQAIAGRGLGVRIGDGSLYDWVVEEILMGGAAPEESVPEEEVEWAMQLLATARAERRLSITHTVEAVFAAAELGPTRRRRRSRR